MARVTNGIEIRINIISFISFLYYHTLSDIFKIKGWPSPFLSPRAKAPSSSSPQICRLHPTPLCEGCDKRPLSRGHPAATHTPAPTAELRDSPLPTSLPGANREQGGPSRHQSMKTTKFTLRVDQAAAIRAGINAPHSTVSLEVDVSKYPKEVRETIADFIEDGHKLTGRLRATIGLYKLVGPSVSLIEGTEQEFRRTMETAAADVAKVKQHFESMVLAKVSAWEWLAKDSTDFPWADGLVSSVFSVDTQIREVCPNWEIDQAPAGPMSVFISDFCRAQISGPSFIFLGELKVGDFDAPSLIREVQLNYVRRMPDNLRTMESSRIMVATCDRSIDETGRHHEEFSFNQAFDLPLTATEKDIQKCAGRLLTEKAGSVFRDIATFRCISTPREAIFAAFKGKGHKAETVWSAVSDENRRRAALAVKAAFSGTRTVSIKSRDRSATLSFGGAAWLFVGAPGTLAFLFTSWKIPGLLAMLCGVMIFLVILFRDIKGDFSFVRDANFMRERAIDCFKEVPDSDKYTHKLYLSGTPSELKA